ncbi:MAG: flavin reductase family protein [Coriobacteriia bacterium]
MRETKIVTGRGVSAMLHPRPAYLVTTCDESGAADASTIAWVTPLSHAPSLIGISVKPSSRTCALIESGGEFVVNVADASLRAAAVTCGNISGFNADKIELAGLPVEPSKEVAPPRLSAALGWMECKVLERIEAGDHVLFVAEVLLAEVRAAAFEDGWDANSVPILQCISHDRFGYCFESRPAITKEAPGA